MPLGSYAINIGPVQGCSYKNFTFNIGPCVPLAFNLETFTATRNQNTVISGTLSGADELAEIVLEGSINGRDFVPIASLPFNKTSASQDLRYEMENSEYVYFRLLMGANNHHAKYSPVRKVGSLNVKNSYQLAGNPVRDEIKLSAMVSRKENLDIQVINQAGQVLATRQVSLFAGNNTVVIPVQKLAPGLYFVKLSTGNSAPETFRVLKQ